MMFLNMILCSVVFLFLLMFSLSCLIFITFFMVCFNSSGIGAVMKLFFFCVSFVFVFVGAFFLIVVYYFNWDFCVKVVPSSFMEVSECVVLFFFMLLYFLVLYWMGKFEGLKMWKFCISVFVVLLLVSYHCVMSGVLMGVWILFVRIWFLVFFRVMNLLFSFIKQYVRKHGIAGRSFLVSMVPLSITKGGGFSDSVSKTGGSQSVVSSGNYMSIIGEGRPSTSDSSLPSLPILWKVGGSCDVKKNVVGLTVDEEVACLPRDILFPQVKYGEMKYKKGTVKDFKVPAEGSEAYMRQCDMWREIITSNRESLHSGRSSHYSIVIPDGMSWRPKQFHTLEEIYDEMSLRAVSRCDLCWSQGGFLNSVSKYLHFVGSSCLSSFRSGWEYLKDMFF